MAQGFVAGAVLLGCRASRPQLLALQLVLVIRDPRLWLAAQTSVE